MGSTNLQSRKWLLTVNNPLDYGLNHAEIKNILHLFNPDYFCLVDEIATTGTRHTHIFIYSKSPIRFSTLKKRFPIAHQGRFLTNSGKIFQAYWFDENIL